MQQQFSKFTKQIKGNKHVKKMTKGMFKFTKAFKSNTVGNGGGSTKNSKKADKELDFDKI